MSNYQVKEDIPEFWARVIEMQDDKDVAVRRQVDSGAGMILVILIVVILASGRFSLFWLLWRWGSRRLRSRSSVGMIMVIMVMMAMMTMVMVMVMMVMMMMIIDICRSATLSVTAHQPTWRRRWRKLFKGGRWHFNLDGCENNNNKNGWFKVQQRSRPTFEEDGTQGLGRVQEDWKMEHFVEGKQTSTIEKCVWYDASQLKSIPSLLLQSFACTFL